MGSSGKKRTTRAKLDREGKVRQKRVDKEARKAARRFAADEAPESVSPFDELADDTTGLEETPVDPGPTQTVPASDVISPDR